MRLYRIAEEDVRAAIETATVSVLQPDGLVVVVTEPLPKFYDLPLKVVYKVLGAAHFLVVTTFPFKGKLPRS